MKQKKATKSRPAKSGPTKKEIQVKIQESVNHIIGELKIENPSKKVKRVVKKTSRLLARKVRQELKIVSSKLSKASRKLNGKVKAAVTTA